jgi:RNA polymerase sigma factor (sigma-70 family)
MDDFSRLVETESRGLVAAVTAVVGDRDRAEEIVQDAFERCYRRWRRVSRLDRPGAWVRRVAINAAISAGRRTTSERRAMALVGARSAIEATSDPIDHLVGDLVDGELWSAVRALPADQASAIVLRYGADLSVDEVAETLEISVAAARSLLHRGRATLRQAPHLQQPTAHAQELR